jgi:hypothetical protein
MTASVLDNTGTAKYRKRAKAMREEWQSYKATAKTIAEYMLPRRGKYLDADEDQTQNAGDRKDQKIINGSATDALRVVAAGLQGGLTSPSRPWFVLTFADSDLMEFAPVREWLHEVRTRMLAVLARSNFYTSTHNMYLELAAFGTAAMLIEENFQTVIRCRPFTIGEYTIALDSTYRPNTLYRQFSMSAEQMVQMFGEKNVSQRIRDIWKTSPGQRFEVQHCIQPNDASYDPSKADYRGMEFASVYFEHGCSDGNLFLRKSGYRGIPFVAPRWAVSGVNTYGDSPAMDAIGDVKMLQKLEEKKLKKLDKHVDPAMNAPLSLKAKGGTIISGGVNYLDITQGQQSFSPAYQIDGNLSPVAQEIMTVEQRIRRFFFNDLFLTIIAQEGGPQKTAYEIAKKYEEKLMMLGPVIEQQHAEFHDVALDRLYNVMDGMGLIPPPPKEIQGMEMKTEYVGLLAQAQKMVGMQAVQETAAFVGELSKVYPDVVDKFDADQAVDEFSDMNGTPPKLVVSDEKVAQKRANRAKQQAQAQAAAMVQPGADALKKLSETSTQDGNLLSAAAKAVGGGAKR